jgi:DNA-binding transcriptional ArsR family regulator
VPFTPGRPIAEAKADLFKALGHPVRIRILEILVDRDATVGELAAEIGLPLSHLSQQLAVLRRTGLVRSARVRSNVVSTLGDPEIARLLQVARELLRNHLQNDQLLLDAMNSLDDKIAALTPKRAKRS